MPAYRQQVNPERRKSMQSLHFTAGTSSNGVIRRDFTVGEVTGNSLVGRIRRRWRAPGPDGPRRRPAQDSIGDAGRTSRIVTSRRFFLLEALGQAAVETGKHVAWFTLESLGVLIRRHRADDSLTKAITRILRADLVIVDDIGLLPVSPDAAEGLYRLVDAAYEKRSVAISSNLHPSGFDELMPKTLATATVDRLLHHAHLCQTTGDSVRLSQALAGKGVKPLE
jgi:hypothetical protein